MCDEVTEGIGFDETQVAVTHLWLEFDALEEISFVATVFESAFCYSQVVVNMGRKTLAVTSVTALNKLVEGI